MKIENIINSPDITKPTKVDDIYIARILVVSDVVYYKPVDFKMMTIEIPLTAENIDVKYDKYTKEKQVSKGTFQLNTYYPPSTAITLPDGDKLNVLKYKSLKTINNTAYTVIVCTYAENTTADIIRIDSECVTEKILEEMNKILVSNECLKHLLPQYSYNWMLYDDTKLSDTSAYKSLSILDNIGFLEYREQLEQQKYYKSFLESNYTVIPNTLINQLYDFAVKFSAIRIPIKLGTVTRKFRTRAIATWLLSIAENIDKNIDYDKIYLVNKYDDETNIIFYVADNEEIGKNICFEFYTPQTSIYNFKINMNKVIRTSDGFSYNIDSIRLIATHKQAGTDMIVDNVSKQYNNFEAFVKVLEAISAYNMEGNMEDYYYNIPAMLNKMKLTKNTVVEDSGEDINPEDESMDDRIRRISNNVFDDKILPKVTNILNTHSLIGNKGDDIDDSTDEIIYGAIDN